MSSIASLNPLQQSTPTPLSLTPKAQATTGAATTGASTSTRSVDALASTFLNLLVQELQNQDPTAPMDSTAMVGQMISLNQLDQLASINQLLNNQFPSTTAAAKPTGGIVPGEAKQANPAAAAAAQAALAQLAGANLSPAASSAASSATSSLASLPSF